MCGRRALLPNTMKVLVQYDRTSAALYRGGFGDVWKGEYRHRDVAVKVVRTYSNSDLQKIVGVSCRLCSLSLGLFADMRCVEVLQRGRHLENLPTSERPAADRSDDVRESVRNGVGLDGKRKHQRLREGTPGCRPVGTGRLFNRSFTVSASSLLMVGDLFSWGTSQGG